MPRCRLHCLLAAALLAASGQAAHAGEQDRVRQGVASGAYKPLTAILADVARQHPGRVVDVESKRGVQGDLRYEITLIDASGGKRELLVDAATGRVVAGHDAPLAVDMATLATHLRQIERQTQRRVTEAEYDTMREGRPIYQLRLNPAEGPSAPQQMLIDARTGMPLAVPAAQPLTGGAIRSMPDMLQTLAVQFAGSHVVEVELEADSRKTPYYELELRQPDGQTLELRVDARTLAVLQRRLDDD